MYIEWPCWFIVQPMTDREMSPSEPFRISVQGEEAKCTESDLWHFACNASIFWSLRNHECFECFWEKTNRFERSTWRWTKMLWKSQFRFDSLWFQLLMPKSCQVEAKHKGRLLQLCSVELSCATITVWELCCFEHFRTVLHCYMRLSEFNCPRFFLKQSHVGQELGVQVLSIFEQSTLWIFMHLYESLCIFMHLYESLCIFMHLYESLCSRACVLRSTSACFIMLLVI
jgi:hypothetical protein